MPRVSLLARLTQSALKEEILDTIYPDNSNKTGRSVTPEYEHDIEKKSDGVNNDQSSDSDESVQGTAKPVGCSFVLPVSGKRKPSRLRRQSSIFPQCNVAVEKLPKPGGPAVLRVRKSFIATNDDSVPSLINKVVSRPPSIPGLNHAVGTLLSSINITDTVVEDCRMAIGSKTLVTTRTLHQIQREVSKLKIKNLDVSPAEPPRQSLKTITQQRQSMMPSSPQKGWTSSALLPGCFFIVASRLSKKQRAKRQLDRVKEQLRTQRDPSEIIPLKKHATREDHRREVASRRDKALTQRHENIIQTKKKKARDSEIQRIEMEQAEQDLSRALQLSEFIALHLMATTCNTIMKEYHARKIRNSYLRAVQSMCYTVIPAWRKYRLRKRRQAMHGLLVLSFLCVKWRRAFLIKRVELVRKFLFSYRNDKLLAIQRFYTLARKAQNMLLRFVRVRRSQLYLLRTIIDIVEGWHLLSSSRYYEGLGAGPEAKALAAANLFKRGCRRFEENIPRIYKLVSASEPPLTVRSRVKVGFKSRDSKSPFAQTAIECRQRYLRKVVQNYVYITFCRKRCLRNISLASVQPITPTVTFGGSSPSKGKSSAISFSPAPPQSALRKSTGRNFSLVCGVRSRSISPIPTPRKTRQQSVGDCVNKKRLSSVNCEKIIYKSKKSTETTSILSQSIISRYHKIKRRKQDDINLISSAIKANRNDPLPGVLQPLRLSVFAKQKIAKRVLSILVQQSRDSYVRSKVAYSLGLKLKCFNLDTAVCPPQMERTRLLCPSVANLISDSVKKELEKAALSRKVTGIFAKK